MALVRARAVVSGRVQGVFFRYTMCQEAERLKVNGWVANRWDGAVEMLMEGDKPAVESLITWCHHGPPGAAVRKVEVEWQEYKGDFSSFSVKGWG